MYNLNRDLQTSQLCTHLKPEAEVVPFASIDGAVKRCSLTSIDLNSFYSEEVRCVHYEKRQIFIR